MQSNKQRFVLGVDLDGVVADFYGAMRPIAAEWLGKDVRTLTTEVTFGLKEWGIEEGRYEDMHRFAVGQRGLFREIPPMPGAAAALRRLSDRQVRIRIVTNRLYLKYIHKDTVAQTVEWLERHGIPYWDLCFMRDKTAVGADLYIDDNPSNIEPLRAQGYKVLVFSNSTNRDVVGDRVNSWEEAERRIVEESEAWRLRPKAA